MSRSSRRSLDHAVESSITAILAGDLNFDVSQGPAAILLQRAGFRSVFGQSRVYTRPAHNFLSNPRSIDWALVSGPVKASQPKVHSSVAASDHYPISFTLGAYSDSATELVGRGR